MDGLVQDLRLALRVLIRSPRLSLTVMAVMALGVGFNGAVFSIVNGVLLRPLPFWEPDGLAKIYESHPERKIASNVVSPPTFMDWKGQNRSFRDMAAYYTETRVLTGPGEPRRVVSAATSAALFSVLGATTQVGRTFTAEEDRPGGEVVAVLSDALWRKQYGSDASILGRRILLDGQAATVVGVLRAGREFPEGTEIWLPLAIDPADTQIRGSRFLDVIARLRPGVQLEQARTEMESIGRRLAQAYPEAQAGWSVSVIPLREDLVGEVRRTLLVLLAAVTLVVVAACANVASLLLARATARQREIALRNALGASRWQVTRPLVLESLILSFAAGAFGILVGWRAIDLLLALNPKDLPRLAGVGFDANAALYTLLLSVVTGTIFGLAPAIVSTRPNLGAVIKEGDGRIAGGGGRLRELLVIGEVAISMILLIGAALLIRSFLLLMNNQPGFRPENLAILDFGLSPNAYSEGARQAAFVTQLVERARALPGVTGAAVVSHLPVSGIPRLWNNSFKVDGRPPLPPGVKLRSHLRWVTPRYFRTLGIPLLAGRDFDARDQSASPKVIVIDEEMRRRYFPNEDPLGKKVSILFNEPELREIVGVVGTVKQTDLTEEAVPHLYIPYDQSPRGFGHLVVRAGGDPAEMAQQLRKVATDLDRAELFEVTTMDEHLAESMAQRRFNLLLVFLFAIVSLTLAIVGIYAVVSYHVVQRRREIGVRLALGALPSTVVKMVVNSGMKLVLLGVVVGASGALLATRLLANLLFGVTPRDPATYCLAGVLLALVAFTACYFPARRAARIDPVTTLREGS